MTKVAKRRTGNRMSGFAILSAVAMLAAPAIAQKPTLPQLPTGIAGFFDPVTHIFTPLNEMAPAITNASPISGTINIVLDYDFLYKYPTANCQVIVSFGNNAGSPPQFFANHFASATENFSAKNPETTISVPFDYTPNGNGTPKLKFSVTCQAYDHANVEHDGGYDSGTKDIQPGDSSYKAAVKF